MASLTAPSRFYSATYPSLKEIVSLLNPFPPMQFIQFGEWLSLLLFLI